MFPREGRQFEAAFSPHSISFPLFISWPAYVHINAAADIGCLPPKWASVAFEFRKVRFGVRSPARKSTRRSSAQRWRQEPSDKGKESLILKGKNKFAAIDGLESRSGDVGKSFFNYFTDREKLLAMWCARLRQCFAPCPRKR